MTLLLLCLVVVAAGAVSLTAYGAADDRVKDAERRVRDLRWTLDQVRTTVTEHRDTSPALCDEVLAAIATAERRADRP